MSGHGGFSAIGSGMQVPQPLAMPNVEELQPGKDKLGGLNVEGHKAEAQIADTRLDQTRRQPGHDAPQGGEDGFGSG